MLEELNKICSDCRFDVPLSEYTTFGVGGSADALVNVKDEAELASVVDFCKTGTINFFLIGGGSNILVSDKGYRGVVIKLNSNFCNFKIEAERINCGAGVPISRIANVAADWELSGLEFAVDLPGTAGGAIVGNAGCYGQVIGEIVESVRFLEVESLKFLKKENVSFRYRGSEFKGENEIIVEAVLSLKKDKNVTERVKNNRTKRRENQPVGLKSAGSIFKNPDKMSAWKMIDSIGWRGRSCGGAVVSDKHPNFILNTGNAKASDIKNLIDGIIERVLQRFNIKLEPEIVFLGEFD